MTAKHLLSLLNVRSDEARMASLVALFFALIDLDRAIGDSVADALFFRRFGVENLPYMYIGLGTLTFAASLGYAAFVGRLEKGRFFTLLLGLMAALLLAERAALLLDLRALYPVLWLSINIIATLLGTLVWTAAAETCDTRQAKRLFPLFVSASILGNLAGSLLIGPAARWLGTKNLILLNVVLLAEAAVLVRTLARGHFRVSDKPPEGSTFLDDIQAGFNYVRRAPLLQLLAISAVLFSVLYFSVSFPFGKAVSAAFTTDADLAGFLGLFKGVSSLVMFLAALLIANRLYARIGIVNALLILPIIYLLGFVLFAANFSLSTAVIVRLAQFVVLSGIGDGAYSAFFNVAPPELRAQVRAFDSGVPSQIGIIGSGILLLLADRLLNTRAVFVMGIIAAVACALVVWRMHPRYRDALLAALQAGRLDIFAEGYRTFAGLAQDREATGALVKALDDPKPATRRLAAEMLARIGARQAVPDLITRLDRAEGESRPGLVRALGQLGDPRALEPVAALLQADSAELRTAALEALPALRPAGDLLHAARVLPLLSDPAFPVRVQAAICLARLGDAQTALGALLGFLSSASAEHDRVLALRSFQPVLTTAHRTDMDRLAPVVQALDDASPDVRRAAIEGLTGTSAPPVLQALAGRLSDPAPGVRVAAAQALRQSGAAATPFVAACLKTARDAAAVLDAFSANDPAAHVPLRDYAQEIIGQLRAWREASRALPTEGAAIRLLGQVLQARTRQAEQRLVKIIGLIGNERAMRQVATALSSSNAEARATAVEALDTLGDRRLVRALLPLLEATTDTHEPRTGPPATAAETLQRLAASEDDLVRQVATRARAELGPANPTELLGGTMETLQTLSLIDRALLLRDVPLFGNLAPEDLVQIAQVAQERWFPDGALLCREGEPGDELFIIASGQVRVSREADGGSLLLATRQVGEFVGEMAVIEAVPRFATVTAHGDTRTLVISGTSFRAILQDCPDVALGVMQGLSRRLREPRA
jgi:HEAT repeat protein